VPAPNGSEAEVGVHVELELAVEVDVVAEQRRERLVIALGQPSSDDQRS
jgi:hypothetical protein